MYTVKQKPRGSIQFGGGEHWSRDKHFRRHASLIKYDACVYISRKSDGQKKNPRKFIKIGQKRNPRGDM